MAAACTVPVGTILGSRVKDDGKMVFEVLVDQHEALQLKGHIDNVHLFSENVADTEVVITQRGTNEATTYLLVPRELRKDEKLHGRAKCQRIDTKNKTILIYTIDRKGLP